MAYVSDRVNCCTRRKRASSSPFLYVCLRALPWAWVCLVLPVEVFKRLAGLFCVCVCVYVCGVPQFRSCRSVHLRRTAHTV